MSKETAPKLIDYRQTPLDAMHIMTIAGGLQSPEMNTQLFLASMLQELSNGHTFALQLRNTLFVVNRTDHPTTVFFRPLNADVISNYLQSMVDFIRFMQEDGIQIMMTQFSDPRMVQFAKAVKRLGVDAYHPNSVLQILPDPEGLYVLVIYSDPSLVENPEGIIQ